MIESLFNPEFMTRELAFGMNLAESSRFSPCSS